MVIQFAISIKIEVSKCISEVFRLHLSEAIFPLELSELLRIDRSTVPSVNAFECCIRLEVPHGRQNLS